MTEKNTQPKPKCFVIMPIAEVPGYEGGHFSRVYEYVLKPAIAAAGYQPIRADDAVKTDYIVVGIIQQIVESEMVVCDFSARNPNVMYELGLRHAFNKPVVLIKDKRTEKIFDIQGLRYSEYDETLRIDSVQKDISRITSAIAETAKAEPQSVNSVVKLAGIKTAEVPAGQTISNETNLLLQAIGGIDKRLTTIENQRLAEKYFYIYDNKVHFHDNITAGIGDRIYDEDYNSIGELIDIHPVDETIHVKLNSGKIVPFHASSVSSKGITGLPF